MKYEIKVSTSLEETNVLYLSTTSYEMYCQLGEYVSDEFYHEHIKTYTYENSIAILVEEGDYSA